jgi:hypothetical protein
VHRSGALVCYAGAPSVTNHQAVRRCSRQQGKIRSGKCRTQKGCSRAPTFPITHRHVAQADAEAALAGEIIVTRQPHTERCLDERFGERTRRHRRNGERAARTVIRIRTTIVVLRLLEVRKNARVVPARITEIRPRVVVRPIAANIDHRVKRTASTENFAARKIDRAIRCRLLRDRRIAPVVGRHPHLPRIRRYVDVRIRILAARFDEEDRGRRIPRQSRSNDAAARTGTDDDVIVVAHCRPPTTIFGRSPACSVSPRAIARRPKVRRYMGRLTAGDRSQ